MKRNALAVVAVVGVALAAGGGYWLGVQGTHGGAAQTSAPATAASKGVAASALLPAAAAATVSGTIDGSGRFDGTGDSLEAVLGAERGVVDDVNRRRLAARLVPATLVLMWPPRHRFNPPRVLRQELHRS